MRDNGILDTISTLIAVDPACLDRDGVRDVMAKIRHVQGWASAGLLECTRRLEELSTASNPGADASFALAGAMDQTSAEANSTVDQAALCNTNTELEDSLAAGEITSRHLATISTHRSRLEAHERSDFDAELPRIHDWARHQHFKMFQQSLRDLVARIKHRHRPESDAEALERQRAASKIKTWVEESTGLHNFLLTMDPVRAAKFNSAVQAELAAARSTAPDHREPFGSLQIDAVVSAMSGGEAAKRSSELIVVVDHDTLITGRHDNTLCETIDGAPVAVPFVRELCQDAILNLFAVDRHGNICDAIDERTANRAQRRALAAMYRSCAFPHCAVGFSQCRMHHVQYSRDHGKTQLGNLIPVCETHHHHIHDLGWTLTLDPVTRDATFTEPGDHSRPNDRQQNVDPDPSSKPVLDSAHSAAHRTRPDRRPARRSATGHGSDDDEPGDRRP